MLTPGDICELIDTDAETLARKVKNRSFPAPIRIGAGYRWREEDFALYMAYLIACSNYRDETGKDPWAPDSPIAPPVYSTGIPARDLRTDRARLQEQRRELRSKTLRRARSAAESDIPGDREPVAGLGADTNLELRVHDEPIR